VKQFCSNRTIVGLKLRVEVFGLIMWSQQQSHHCGIEIFGKASAENLNEKQQSHHCGIEMQQPAAGMPADKRAAIAPLWDWNIDADNDLSINDCAAIAPLWDWNVIGTW